MKFADGFLIIMICAIIATSGTENTRAATCRLEQNGALLSCSNSITLSDIEHLNRELVTQVRFWGSTLDWGLLTVQLPSLASVRCLDGVVQCTGSPQLLETDCSCSDFVPAVSTTTTTTTQVPNLEIVELTTIDPENEIMTTARPRVSSSTVTTASSVILHSSQPDIQQPPIIGSDFSTRTTTASNQCSALVVAGVDSVLVQLTSVHCVNTFLGGVDKTIQYGAAFLCNLFLSICGALWVLSRILHIIVKIKSSTKNYMTRLTAFVQNKSRNRRGHRLYSSNSSIPQSLSSFWNRATGARSTMASNSSTPTVRFDSMTNATTLKDIAEEEEIELGGMGRFKCDNNWKGDTVIIVSEQEASPADKADVIIDITDMRATTSDNSTRHAQSGKRKQTSEVDRLKLGNAAADSDLAGTRQQTRQEKAAMSESKNPFAELQQPQK